MLVAKTVAAAVLPIATSATVVTEVTTGGVTLFVGCGSFGKGPTLATFVRLPLAGAFTTNVKFVI